MAFTLDPQTGKISFGVVADGTHDAISLDLASQFGVSEDFKDNFTLGGTDFFDNFSGSDNWDDSGTQILVNTTTDVIDWDTPNNVTHHATAFDLGVGMVSDIKWTLRFKLTVSNLTQGASANNTLLYVDLTDADETQDSSVSNDFIGLSLRLNDTNNEIYVADGTAVTRESVFGDTAFSHALAVETLYVQINRTSATSYRINLFSDATYTTLIESLTGTCDASNGDHRYIKVSTNSNGDTTSHTLDGTIDDVEFYNGASPLLWSPGVTGRTEITGGALEFTYENGGDDTIANDQGSISNTSWVFRTKLVLDTAQNPNASSTHGAIMLSDSIAGGDTSQKCIGFKMLRNASAQKSFRVFASDTGSMTAPDDEITLVTNPGVGTYYIELIRTSASSVTVNIFEDSEYTALLETDTLTITGTVTGLRYISVTNRQTASQTTPAYIGRYDDMQLWNEKTTPIISSLNWRARFKLDITNLDDGANATNKELYIGLTDVDAVSKANEAHDGYLFHLTHDNAVSDFIVRTPDGQAPQTAPDDATFATAPAVDTFYIELLRDSASQTTTSIYDDETFTTLTESEVVAGISGSDNLKYLKLFNNFNTLGAGAIDGTFDDFTFTDLAVPTPTMSKIFTVDALVKSLGDNGCSNFFDDFSGLDNWDDAGTKIGVNTATDVIDFDGSKGGTLEATALDLGAGGVSDTSWTLRFKIDVTATAFTTGNTTVQIGLFENDETVGGILSLASQDFIAIEYNVQNTTGIRRYVARSHDDTSTFGNNVFLSGVGLTTHYIEMIRNSATSITYNIYSDAGFTNLLATTTTVIPATLKGLQYIKVRSNESQSDGGTLTGTIDNVDLVRPCPSVTVDSCLRQSFDEEFTIEAILSVRESFTIDARLSKVTAFTIDALPFILPVQSFLIDACLQDLNTIETFLVDGRLFVTNTETFTMDGIPFNEPSRLFVVDAIIETFGPERSNMGDIIIRVLQENPPSLTGTEIVEEVVILTTITDPTRYRFIGKTSRVKNWLGFLERKGIVQDDGSSPDWYRTNWSLI